MPKKVAVIDMTHGGIPIAQKLNENGFFVTAIDVYDSLDLKTISTLNKEYGIYVTKEPICVDEFDFIVSPLHLNPNYAMLKSAKEKGIEIITHHEIVNKILSNDKRILDFIKFIEISGTKAKTSTASILASIISQNSSVILHTSRGISYIKNGKITKIDKLSTTPGNILKVIDKTISLLPIFYIFEVSIGFTGYADLNILTTLNNDVLIASGSIYESDAILQTIYNGLKYSRKYNRNSKILVNSDVCCRIDSNILANNNNNINLITFNENFEILKEVGLITNENLAKRKCIMLQDSESIEFDLQSNYDFNSYRTALSASVAASIELGIKLDIIKYAISKFKGIDGRMLKKDFKGRILIDNSNSGMDVQSVKSAFDYALTFLRNDKRIIFILGLESKTVCEGLDMEKLIKFIEKQYVHIDKIIWVSDSQKLIDYLIRNVFKFKMSLNQIVKDISCSVEQETVEYISNSNEFKYFNNVGISMASASNRKDGLNIALNNTKEGDIILYCVKCFR